MAHSDKLKHADDKHAEGQYVVRFSPWARFQHLMILVLFALLLLTGMPQKWPYGAFSQWLIDALGGIFVVRWLHRASGVLFAVLTAAHLSTAIFALVTRRARPSMFLTRRDFDDAILSLRYYLGREDTGPKFGRYDYKQKFEYWGLIFGSLIMVATGFVLFFPIVVSRWLPAELIPAAKVMHSNEALLAMLIIVVWHLYGAILSPEVFPLDTSVFTGKISRARLKHEHALEYQELFGDPVASDATSSDATSSDTTSSAAASSEALTGPSVDEPEPPS